MKRRQYEALRALVALAGNLADQAEAGAEHDAAAARTALALEAEHLAMQDKCDEAMMTMLAELCPVSGDRCTGPVYEAMATFITGKLTLNPALR